MSVTTFYEIPINTELGNKLIKLESKFEKIREKSKTLCEKVKADIYYSSPNPFVFIGGFYAFGFKEPPENIRIWRIVKKDNRTYYFPKQNSNRGKELQQKMDDVDVITIEDLDDIFKPKKAKEHSYLFKIGIIWIKNGVFKISFNPDLWEIPTLQDYKEITYSNYN